MVVSIPYVIHHIQSRDMLLSIAQILGLGPLRGLWVERFAYYGIRQRRRAKSSPYTSLIKFYQLLQKILWWRYGRSAWEWQWRRRRRRSRRHNHLPGDDTTDTTSSHHRRRPPLPQKSFLSPGTHPFTPVILAIIGTAITLLTFILAHYFNMEIVHTQTPSVLMCCFRLYYLVNPSRARIR